MMADVADCERDPFDSLLMPIKKLEGIRHPCVVDVT